MTFVREIQTSKAVAMTAAKRKEIEALIAEKHKEGSRLVKGIFKNLECPGGSVEFPFKEFPQDPIRLYKFEDGKTYEIPINVARHINNNCMEKVHQYVVDKNGDKVTTPGRGKQRYQFLSTDFM